MKEEIEKKLEHLQKNVENLKSLKDITRKELEEDTIKRAAIERYFQMSIETVIDICSMIISFEDLEKPDDYREMILELGEVNILEKEFAENFSDVAGFRNILVHQYAEIDPEKLLHNLNNNLNDFDEFAKQIASYTIKK